MTARIDHLVTSGTFSLDGGTWDVDNNVWLVGDDNEVIVIDPAHSPEQVVEAVAGRTTKAILLTHGHDDHIRAVAEVKQLLGNAPVYLNPDDRMLWDTVYPDSEPDEMISDANEFTVAGVTLRAIHTPGHSPGSTCFYIEKGASLPAGAGDAGGANGSDAGVSDVGASDGDDGDGHDGDDVPVLFSGDTLFSGGPGATGRSYSDFGTIIESISGKLFALPDDTVVLTGHGDSTTIGAEKPHLQEWIERGH